MVFAGFVLGGKSYKYIFENSIGRLEKRCDLPMRAVGVSGEHCKFLVWLYPAGVNGGGILLRRVSDQKE